MDQYQWIKDKNKQPKSVDHLINIVVPYTQFSKLHKLG